jgi:hypothetical protein
MAVAFDTLAFAERLRAGGFTEEQAKAATEAFARATGQQLATKADLDSLEQRLVTRMAEGQNSLLRWLVPLLVGQAALTAALVKLL